MAFCDLCEQRILSDGEDSYILSEDQMAKLVVDSSILAAFEFTGTFQSGYASVCDDCISKGYVSPFKTRKTYPIKNKLTESEIKRAKEISLAVGRGEPITQIINSNSTNIEQKITNEEKDKLYEKNQKKMPIPTNWKQVIISSSLAGLIYGALYRFVLEDHEKLRMIVFALVWLSLMASISPFSRKAIGFLLFMFCTLIWIFI